MNHKISFCTVCMNRLSHLQQTLPENIADNQDYPNVEFLVLDYNSTEDVGGWIKTKMRPHLDSGVLTYIRVEGPKYFHRSHSRNLALKMAQGDIVVNLDADNYAGKGFASYLNQRFLEEEHIFLSPELSSTDKLGSFGKVSLRKKDFLAIKGYDESISGYGFEDTDFYERLKNHGLKERKLTQRAFLKAISHGHEERINNQKNFKDLHQIFGKLTKESAELFYFYKDRTFERGTLLFDTSKVREDLFCLLKDEKLRKGKWSFADSQYSLHYEDTSAEEQVRYSAASQSIQLKDAGTVRTFNKVIDQDLINNALLMSESAKNFYTYKRNADRKSVVVNENFGAIDPSKVFLVC